MAIRIPSSPLATAVSITVLVLAVACGGNATQGPPSPPDLQSVALERVFENLTFRRLTGLVQAGGRFFVTEQTGRVMSFPSGRFFVTEQTGRVMSFPSGPEAPEPAAATVFLDIRDRVNRGGNEEGLLGLAFDPEFASNGHFYVYYSATRPRRSIVSRFTAATSSAATAEPKTELVVMEIPQPYQNHNGGQLVFGPDGMLYISLGDGGLGGDPQGNGQDIGSLLGSILRIDVSGIGPDAGYRVPPDNPFAGTPNGRGEIWAFGFRNPWRFSFDRQTGDLWAGDVGQNSYEEVDLVLRGGNYGWNILEGGHCFSPRTGCDPSGTELPVIEYSLDEGCSVIGGYVYRGTRIPSLNGTYLYGDFCSGEIHGFRIENGDVVEHRLMVDSGLRITSFGEDENGEIYVLSQNDGIYRLKADG